MALRVVWAITVAFAAGLGCYRAPKPACGFFCGPDGACPADYMCAHDGRCHLNTAPASLVCEGPDAAATIDAPFDVPPDE